MSIQTELGESTSNGTCSKWSVNQPHSPSLLRSEPYTRDRSHVTQCVKVSATSNVETVDQGSVRLHYCSAD